MTVPLGSTGITTDTGRASRPGISGVSLENACRYNLRDYGGYATRSGARVKTAVLYRSGELDHAEAEDHALVERLGIRWVIDFRGHSEIADTPPPAFWDYTGQFFFAPENDNTIPHAIADLAALDDLGQAVQHLAEVYRKLPESKKFVASMRGYLDALARAEGPSLVHCFAGKDRTGLAVALVHSLLGVHPDDRMADYLLTNDMGETRIEAGAMVLRRQAPPGTPDWVIREAMGVRPEYLQAALGTITGTYGSPERYLGDRVGTEASLLERIAGRYCE